MPIKTLFHEKVLYLVPIHDDEYDDEYDVNRLWKWIIAGALFFDVSIVGLASLSVVLLLSMETVMTMKTPIFRVCFLSWPF